MQSCAIRIEVMVEVHAGFMQPMVHEGLCRCVQEKVAPTLRPGFKACCHISLRPVSRSVQKRLAMKSGSM